MNEEVDSEEGDESDDKRPLSPRESLRNLEEAKRSFREKVASYRPMNLIESERKKKRDSGLDPSVRIGGLRSRESQSNAFQSSANEPPTVTAWPVRSSARLSPAGEKRRRKRPSRSQRLEKKGLLRHSQI